MTKFRLKIAAHVKFEFNPQQYPPGTSPEVALSWELEQAAQDPAEYLAMPGIIAEVTGAVMNDGRSDQGLPGLDHATQRASQRTKKRCVGPWRSSRSARRGRLCMPYQRLGMIDAQAQMALIRASVGRSLQRAKDADVAPGQGPSLSRSARLER